MFKNDSNSMAFHFHNAVRRNSKKQKYQSISEGSENTNFDHTLFSHNHINYPKLRQK